MMNTGLGPGDPTMPVQPEAAGPPSYRHKVDLRFTTPKWLGRIYVDLRVGKDTRGGTRPYYIPTSVKRRNRVVAAALAQMAVAWVLALTLVVAWLFQMGCGAGMGTVDIPSGPGPTAGGDDGGAAPTGDGGTGGGGTGGTGSPSGPGDNPVREGGVSLTIYWPEVTAQSIPTGAQSISVTVRDKALQQQLGRAVAPQGTTTLTIDNLPAGVLCTIIAAAHPDAAGNDTPMATAALDLVIPDGTYAEIVLSLASTVTTLDITPSPAEVRTGHTLALTATPKDSEGHTVFVAGPLQWTSSSAAVVSVAQTGIVTAVGASGSATITVTDADSGATGNVTVTIQANAPPTASLTADPLSGYTPLLVTMSGSGSDSDGTVAQYSLDYEGNGSIDWTSADPPSGLTYTFGTPGTYTPTLTVVDNDGAATTKTASVVVQAGPVLSVSTNDITIQRNAGAQSFNIGNTGGGTLNWSCSTSAAWLSASPTSGTGAGAPTVSIDWGSIPMASQTATVTVTSNGGTAMITVHVPGVGGIHATVG